MPVSFLLLAAAAAGALPEVGWSFTPRAAAARLPAPPPDLPVQLILDDDTSEGDFGFGGAVPMTARQFMWFNQFSVAGSAQLEEIWVLFPPGPNMAVDADVQLAVYQDPDADPTNGATLLATYDVTVEVLDGVTFSVYPLPSPLPISGEVLIGVVNRFVESDVTGTTSPAALDATASQGRSWVAVWTDDPPTSPELPPDLLLDPVDVFVSGNWMIRGFGRPGAVVEIPTLGSVGLGLLMLLTGAAAVRRLRGRG